jgi:hypothetical protein
MNDQRGRSAPFLGVLTLALGTVLAGTTAILIPQIELGAGVNSKPGCLSSSVVEYGTTLEGRLSQVTVTQIGADCAGQWISISLFTSNDGSGDAVEQVVWQMPTASNPPVGSYTANADGETTGVVSGVIWPSSESGASGLLSGTSAISVSTINSFLLETSDTPLTDSY